MAARRRACATSASPAAIDGAASTLDLTVRAAAALAEHHVRTGDRVGLLVVAADGARVRARVRAAAPAAAARHPGPDPHRGAQRSRRAARPRRGAGSVVYVLSPMLFTPLVTATASLQRGGPRSSCRHARRARADGGATGSRCPASPCGCRRSSATTGSGAWPPSVPRRAVARARHARHRPPPAGAPRPGAARCVRDARAASRRERAGGRAAALLLVLPCAALALRCRRCRTAWWSAGGRRVRGGWARLPDHAVGVVPLALVAGWWTVHDVVDWRLLVVGVLLATAHVAATLRRRTAPRRSRSTRAWPAVARPRRAGTGPLPLTWLAVRGLDPRAGPVVAVAAAPGWSWSACWSSPPRMVRPEEQ